MDIKETGLLGLDVDKHWYYRSKARAMIHVLDNIGASIVLDVGAGSGFFSKYLLKHSNTKEVWCVDIGYEEDFDSSIGEKTIHYCSAIKEVAADLVLLMDVLEHVDNDVGLLQEYMCKVPGGSHFLITVPAFQFLWSGHDDFLEHKRRYTLNQVEVMARKAGLDIKFSMYYFGFVFPIAATLRLVSKLRKNDNPARSQLAKHSPLVNSILGALCASELHLMHFNKFAGLSIFCLAKKV